MELRLLKSAIALLLVSLVLSGERVESSSISAPLSGGSRSGVVEYLSIPNSYDLNGETNSAACGSFLNSGLHGSQKDFALDPGANNIQLNFPAGNVDTSFGGCALRFSCPQASSSQTVLTLRATVAGTAGSSSSSLDSSSRLKRSPLWASFLEEQTTAISSGSTTPYNSNDRMVEDALLNPIFSRSSPSTSSSQLSTWLGAIPGLGADGVTFSATSVSPASFHLVVGTVPNETALKATNFGSAAIPVDEAMNLEISLSMSCFSLVSSSSANLFNLEQDIAVDVMPKTEQTNVIDKNVSGALKLDDGHLYKSFQGEEYRLGTYEDRSSLDDRKAFFVTCPVTSFDAAVEAVVDGLQYYYSPSQPFTSNNSSSSNVTIISSAVRASTRGKIFQAGNLRKSLSAVSMKSLSGFLHNTFDTLLVSNLATPVSDYSAQQKTLKQRRRVSWDATKSPSLYSGFSGSSISGFYLLWLTDGWFVHGGGLSAWMNYTCNGAASGGGNSENNFQSDWQLAGIGKPSEKSETLSTLQIVLLAIGGACVLGIIIIIAIVIRLQSLKAQAKKEKKGESETSHHHHHGKKPMMASFKNISPISSPQLTGNSIQPPNQQQQQMSWQEQHRQQLHNQFPPTSSSHPSGWMSGGESSPNNQQQQQSRTRSPSNNNFSRSFASKSSRSNEGAPPPADQNTASGRGGGTTTDSSGKPLPNSQVNNHHNPLSAAAAVRSPHHSSHHQQDQSLNHHNHHNSHNNNNNFVGGGGGGPIPRTYSNTSQSLGGFSSTNTLSIGGSSVNNTLSGGASVSGLSNNTSATNVSSISPSSFHKHNTRQVASPTQPQFMPYNPQLDIMNSQVYDSVGAGQQQQQQGEGGVPPQTSTLSSPPNGEGETNNVRASKSGTNTSSSSSGGKFSNGGGGRSQKSGHNSSNSVHHHNAARDNTDVESIALESVSEIHA